METRNPKTRDNYAPGFALTQERFEQIFGKRRLVDKDGNIVRAKSLKDKPVFSDNYNASDILKIGREINRYKQLDGASAKEVDARFGKDANRFMRRKGESTLVKDMAREVVRELRRT